MLINVDSPPNTQIFPVNLKTHGINPYNEALFRVVWSETRYYLVGGTHTTYDQQSGGYSSDAEVKKAGKDRNVVRREVGMKWLPLYPERKQWILELWKSSFAFTGMSKAQWDREFIDPPTGLPMLGPYPERGDYMECLGFPEQPTLSVIENVIYRIKAGWIYSFGEKKAAIEQEEANKKRQKEGILRDIFDDSQQAFKNNASSVRPGKKTKKDIKLVYSAEDVGINKHGFSTKGT